MSHIIFYINIKEWRNITKRHCSTILFFHSSQISHVYPLNSFLCSSSRTTQVQSILLTQHLNFLQSLYLFCDFFTQANTFISHRTCQMTQIILFSFNQTIKAIQSQTAIVTNYTSTCIVIRQSGQKAQRAEWTNFFSICIKHTIIMCFTIMSKNIFYLRVNFYPIFTTRFLYNFNTTERLDGATQYFISLQSNNHLIILINISCSKRRNSRNSRRIERAYSIIRTFFG